MKTHIRLLPFLWTFALLSASLQAATPRLQVSVNPGSSRNGEPVLFKISLRNDSATPVRAPRMPVLTDWAILNSYRQENPISVIENGRILYRYNGEFSWVLKPLRNGNLRIPPLELSVGTTRYTTEPLTVPVAGAQSSQGAPPPTQQQPSPSPSPRTQQDPFDDALPESTRRQNFFIRAESSATSVYQGELITLAYALYEKSASITNPEIAKFPDFKGFLKEELSIAKVFSRTPVVLQGETYLRSELIRYAVFPLKSGRLRIEPMIFKADFLSSPHEAIEDLMDSMLRGSLSIPNLGNFNPIPMRKSSQAVEIESRPLPAAPPQAHFTGGVGQFSLDVKGPIGTLNVDQPFTVTVKITGKGNVKAIQEPPLELPKGLEPYQTKPDYKFFENATGEKTFEYLILPRAPGPHQIPPIRWTYFDTTKQNYVELTSQPLNFQVEGSGAAPTPPSPTETSTPKITRWAPVRTGPQHFVPISQITANNALVSRESLLAQAALYVVLGLVFFKQKRERQRQKQFAAAPWDLTAERIFAQTQWPRAELAILIDQWTRERLAGLLTQHRTKSSHLRENSYEHYSAASRDELIQALQSLLKVNDHELLTTLKKLWSELDLLRFTGDREAETSLAPKKYFSETRRTLEGLFNKASALTSEDS